MSPAPIKNRRGLNKRRNRKLLSELKSSFNASFDGILPLGVPRRRMPASIPL
jgi:hypothetical protein